MPYFLLFIPQGEKRQLISVGDKNLYYFDGLDILDAADAHLLHDGLHPNTEGYGLMAKNIIKMLDAI